MLSKLALPLRRTMLTQPRIKLHRHIYTPPQFVQLTEEEKRRMFAFTKGRWLWNETRRKFLRFFDPVSITSYLTV